MNPNRSLDRNGTYTTNILMLWMQPMVRKSLMRLIKLLR